MTIFRTIKLPSPHIAILFIAAAFLVFSRNLSAPITSPADTDFIEYWSAFQATKSSLNPYDPAVLGPLQASAGRTSAVLMMWNPPHLLLLLYPLLSLPLQVAAMLWTALNFFLVIGAARLLIGRKVSLPLIIVTALAYGPLVHQFEKAQLGGLLLFGAALLLRGWITRSVVAMSIGLLFISFKPHLFLPLIFFLLCRSLRERRFAPWANAAALCLASVLAIEGLCPGISMNWLTAVRESSAQAHLVTHAGDWVGATLPGFLRSELARLGYNARPLAFALTFTASVFSAVTALRIKSRTSTEASLGTLYFHLALSLACAPLGWLFDHSTLFPIYISILAVIWAGDSFQCKILKLSASIVLLIAALQVSLFPLYHVQLAWFPIMTAILAWLYNRALHAGSPSPAQSLT